MGRPLVFVTRYSPLALDRGGPIRAYRIAAGLSRRFDLTLVTFGNEAVRDEARRLVPDADVRVAAGGPPAPVGFKQNLLNRSSAEFGRFESTALTTELQRLSAAMPGAILHCDDLVAALAGIKIAAPVRVASAHNVEHRILRQVAGSQPLHKRVIINIEARKVAAEERRVWGAFDMTLACSDVDAQLLRDAGARHVVVCPNGSDAVDRVALPTLAADEPLRLLFVGAGDFWPYEMGIAWFVREVLPLVPPDAPVHLDVVGHKPNNPVAHPAVTYVGRVADVAPYYAAAHALVIPLFQGSGTRLKAIEAAAYGRPVISTTLGVQGLPMQAGVHYLQADDAAGFRREIARLREAIAHTSADLEALLSAARVQAESLFWPAIADRLADTYDAELDARPR